MTYNIAIVGATGVVGSEFFKLLDRSTIKIKELKLFASKKSIGKSFLFRNKTYKVTNLNLKAFKDIDFAIFAAGSKISSKFIPELKKTKTISIDLSSFFREDKNIPLIIPEINSEILNLDQKVIASPNCTTTIMLMALHNLHKNFKIKRIIASTYQAASGGGKKLMDKLISDTKKSIKTPDHNSLYGFNVFLHESPLNLQRYSSEEIKMINETKKILMDDKIKISATCVRVPVIRAHSLSLNVEFEKPFTLKEITFLLKKSQNVEIFQDFKNNRFITPKEASFKKEVFVSRIREDLSNPNTIEMWVSSDQLLKGASFNAFQILENLISLLEAK
ncbi:MAG: Aspartate-semialdehyde dehydrogenase [Candidatus Anoxychlamydiales bacterium]|nr:Aspartate-semialdehyde dehydrogenase [Candidatus Anoxychlamydiales bacterium]NGX36793.1 Aspartate-semialdehyde dehydrogenase [Candidatus Anoxychlamydiales bacterium]